MIDYVCLAETQLEINNDTCMMKSALERQFKIHFNSNINKVAKILKKGCNFLLGRMYFTGNDGYQNFIFFASLLTSLMLDSNKTLTNKISTGISTGKTKQFDTNLELTMSNLANGRVILKFNKSVSVQKKFSSLYSKFILNLYILYELK